MAFRLYIVPVIGDGTKPDPRRPKYFSDGTLSPVPDFSAMDFGFEPWMVVGADLSVSDDALVVGQVDAFAIPFDLSVNLTAPQVTSVKNKLEAINVPAGWVTTSLKWIEVVRSVLGMFLFMQRLGAILTEASGVLTTLFSGSVTLSTQINQLSQGTINALQQAAADLNISTTGITGTTTLRTALKTLADRLSAIPLQFGAVTL